MSEEETLLEKRLPEEQKGVQHQMIMMIVVCRKH